MGNALRDVYYEIADTEETTGVEYDNVNHPLHYNLYDCEVIVLINEALTTEQFEGYLLGNMLKYRLRAGLKGDRTEDLDKSNWYQDYHDEMKTYE